MPIGAEGVEWRDCWGVELPIMAPEASALLRAFTTWIDFCAGNPLPLGSTAQIANLAPLCDRARYRQVVAHMVEGHRQWTSQPAERLVGGDAIAMKEHPELLALGTGSDLAGTWWGMGYARRLYPSIPEWLAADVEAAIGETPDPHRWCYDVFDGKPQFRKLAPPRAWMGDEVETFAHVRPA